MIQCNSLFPQAYDQPKKGFLEICERYPKQTPEFHYYLGMISEYQARPKTAAEYYKKSLKCVNRIQAYVNFIRVHQEKCESVQKCRLQSQMGNMKLVVHRAGEVLHRLADGSIPTIP